jgi:hypothetical protein
MEFEYRPGQDVYYLPKTSRTGLWPTQTPIQWIMRFISPWVKRPAREAYHSPPSNCEVKNDCCYSSATLHCMTLWLLEGQIQFYFVAHL